MFTFAGRRGLRAWRRLPDIKVDDANAANFIADCECPDAIFSKPARRILMTSGDRRRIQIRDEREAIIVASAAA
jgi:hypothetical protein